MNRIVFLLFGALILLSHNAAFSQFKIGYGVAYFPNGMSTLYSEQAFFLESSYATIADGPVTKSKKLLPVHHGFNVVWQSGNKKEKKVNLILKWNYLQNSHKLERTNSTTGEITSFYRKSRLNNYYVGGVFNTKNKIIKSWSLSGLLSQHSLMYFNKNKWEKNGKAEADFGLDAGIQFKITNRVFINFHYTKCFFMFSSYDPSFLGLELEFSLSKNKTK